MHDPEMLKILQRMEGQTETGEQAQPAPGSLSAEKAAMKDILSKLNESVPAEVPATPPQTVEAHPVENKDTKIAQLEARIARLEQLLLG